MVSYDSMAEIEPTSSQDTLDSDASDSPTKKGKHRRNSQVLTVTNVDNRILEHIVSDELIRDNESIENARKSFNTNGQIFLEDIKHNKIQPRQSNQKNQSADNRPTLIYDRPLGMPISRMLSSIPSQDEDRNSQSSTSVSSGSSDGDIFKSTYSTSNAAPSQPPLLEHEVEAGHPKNVLPSNHIKQGLNGKQFLSTSSLDFSSDSDAATKPKSHRSSETKKQRKASKFVSAKQTKKEEKFIKKYAEDLEGEKFMLMGEWKKEFERNNDDNDGDDHQFKNFELFKKARKIVRRWSDMIGNFLSYAECFISNLPLTIGALGLSWVTQGVIWFKFMEENMDSCTTVRFNSVQCTYPEFPGCFECDTTSWIYRCLVTFHYFCHFVAGTCCVLFLLKCCLASKVVADELSNPTTSTPAGVVCITMICVAAGRGWVGEAVVLVTSVFHFALSIWFLYMAIYQYRLWPDPGWFPNTVGIAYAAIKTWLYFPVPGLIFMTICVVYLFSTFFIAIYRATFNHKIAAPVCFISLSAPSIAMYAMTIMAQPTYQEEEVLVENATAEFNFEHMHKNLYLPAMHSMMVLCLVGFVSSLQCLWTRWPQFRLKEFSPAHVAFIFPLLSHTNAVQAYRSGYDSFSETPDGTPFKRILYTYWFTCLVVGTIFNFIFTYKYLIRLPRWTKVESMYIQTPATTNNTHYISNDTEQPSFDYESETGMLLNTTDDESSVFQGWLDNTEMHEELHQSFTNPSVLHANEKGVLMRLRRGTEDYERYGPYVRTRHVQSLGFDLTLTETEFEQERKQLLDWVGRNAPRPRDRTMSIPAVMDLRGPDGKDIYGTFHEAAGAGRKNPIRHQRSNTWTTD